MGQSLKQSILDTVKAAMRAKEKERLATLRLIQSELKRVEVDERVELDDGRVLEILDKMIKQRRDSITQYEAANRPELADAEKKEVEVIQHFLPQPLGEEEVAAIVQQAIASTGAASMQDMGKVMGLVKPQIQGRADVGVVSKLVKAKLG
jgi:uncharacterized protein YqeY